MKKFALFCIVCFAICNVAIADDETPQTDSQEKRQYLCENGQYFEKCDNTQGHSSDNTHCYNQGRQNEKVTVTCGTCYGSGAVEPSYCEKNGDTITCNIKTKSDCSLLGIARTDSTGTFQYQTNFDIDCAYDETAESAQP